VFRVVVAGRGLNGLAPAWERALPRTDWLVEASADTIDAVAECAVHLVADAGLICIGWTDLVAAAGATALAAGRATAVALPGQARMAGRAVKEALGRVAARGFGGGVVLSHFVSVADTPALRFDDVDDMARAALDGRNAANVLACFFNAPRTEVVALVFAP